MSQPRGALPLGDLYSAATSAPAPAASEHDTAFAELSFKGDRVAENQYQAAVVLGQAEAIERLAAAEERLAAAQERLAAAVERVHALEQAPARKPAGQASAPRQPSTAVVENL